MGYKVDTGVILLHIKLPKINGCVKYFSDNNKCMNILINDKGMLDKYNKAWDKISSLLNRGLILSL